MEPVVTAPAPSGTPHRTARPRRDWSVESLRGVAIVLMVAGHVVGGTGEQGMRVPDGSAWRFLYEALEDLRMPLFTVLSGYVYALRPVTARPGLPGFVRGKARRLLVPLLTVGVLLFVTQLVVPGTNTKPEPWAIWRVPVFGYEHLWFLQAIFLIVVLVGWLDAVGRLATPGRWVAVCAASAAGHVVVHVPAAWEVFSVNGALRLLPFFLLGLGMHRFAAQLHRRGVLAAALAVFAAAFAVRTALLLDPVELAPPVVRLLGFTVGLAGVTVLLLLRRRLTWRPFMWLGQFAFPIYLLHVFGSAGSRLVVERLGLQADLAVFVVGMVAALAFPVAVTVTLGRHPLFSAAVLGQRPWRPFRLPERAAERLATS